MKIPKELLYTKEHEWVKQEGEVVTTGITDFAQQMLTDIVFVDLPEAGLQVEKDKPFMVVESVKSVSDIFAVADGEVAEVNEAVADDPALVNSSPFDDGWLVKLKPDSPIDASQFLSASEYAKLCEDSENG